MSEPEIDQTTLTTLFHAWAGRLVLYARQWHDHPTAEDIVQDVFMRLFDTDPPPHDPRAWLFRSVRNAAISSLRSRTRRQRRLRERRSEPTWFTPTSHDLANREAVEHALIGMPIDEREVLVLRLWGDCTLEQVAEITGRSVATVFRQQRRGLAAVRAALEDACHPTPTNTPSPTTD